MSPPPHGRIRATPTRTCVATQLSSQHAFKVNDGGGDTTLDTSDATLSPSVLSSSPPLTGKDAQRLNAAATVPHASPLAATTDAATYKVAPMT